MDQQKKDFEKRWAFIESQNNYNRNALDFFTHEVKKENYKNIISYARFITNGYTEQYDVISKKIKPECKEVFFKFLGKMESLNLINVQILESSNLIGSLSGGPLTQKQIEHRDKLQDVLKENVLGLEILFSKLWATSSDCLIK